MTSFLLKIIGIISMLSDHIGVAFFKSGTAWTYIGRLAFPIFAFQISQGYIHTKDIKKYVYRLFIFASISQIPFILFTKMFSDEYTLNVFFTFLLGIFAIISYDKIKNKFLSFSLIFFLCSTAQLAHVDYGAYGVVCVFLFYMFNSLLSDKKLTLNKKITYKLLMCLTFIIATATRYSVYWIKYPDLSSIYLKFFGCTCLSLIPICLYNGKQGPKAKYLFYIFYPLHFLVLWLIHTYI